jgi:hypothetical protein
VKVGRAIASHRSSVPLNIPLFGGFPGLVSKLWLADDERGRYRGLYEWDDPLLAGDEAWWRLTAVG